MIKTSIAGVTLIELLVVVSIVALASALAIPIYQDYAMRSQVGRVHAELGSLKLDVEEQLARGVDASAVELRERALDAAGEQSLVAGGWPELVIGSDGELLLIAVMGGASGPRVRGALVQLTRTRGGSWSCEVLPAEPAVWRSGYTPSACQLIEASE